MDFELPEHTRAIKDLVQHVVERHCLPLEAEFLRGKEVTDEDLQRLVDAAREAGLWGLNLPKELGGADLSTLDTVVVIEQNYRTLFPIEFGGNPFVFLACEGEQRDRYLMPIIRGEKKFAFAQTEPSGGSDPGNQMRTTAVRDGDDWVINGSKVFISRAGRADVIVVFAVTDPERRQHGGITAFLVDKGTPGLHLVRPIPIMAANGNDKFYQPWELYFEDLRVPASSVLGGIGQGFRLAQRELSTQRMNIGAECLGISTRSYDMMVAYAKQRVLFGEPLAAKQSIQAMIVDSWIDIHTTRLAVQHAACKNDLGQDTRVEAGMLKLIGTEMATRIVDRAIQVHGGYGVTTELPLAHWYNKLRPMRLYEGPSEVHKFQVLARELLHR
ncbi:MAG: acyl-CoA/acyl-ACP dehydrogenase [Chloroflexi bacterium]|nr:acyl-CoA/acyl-ACP dehydrogenase [Chloroflexota bacterium]